jgi:hypothetical protein
LAAIKQFLSGGVMMQKVLPVIVCFALCLAVAMMSPYTLKSNEYVDNASQCLECHGVDYGSTDPVELHVRHVNNTCGSCHEIGDYQAGTVKAYKCAICHLKKCTSVTIHESEHGADCLSCHVECKEGSTTTTSQPEGPCPAEEIYGEHSAEVQILRAVRDNLLSQTPEGREIIKLYYQWAPMITMVVRNDRALKAEMQELIDGILGLSLSR